VIHLRRRTWTGLENSFGKIKGRKSREWLSSLPSGRTRGRRVGDTFAPLYVRRVCALACNRWGRAAPNESGDFGWRAGDIRIFRESPWPEPRRMRERGRGPVRFVRYWRRSLFRVHCNHSRSASSSPRLPGPSVTRLSICICPLMTEGVAGARQCRDLLSLPATPARISAHTGSANSARRTSKRSGAAILSRPRDVFFVAPMSMRRRENIRKSEPSSRLPTKPMHKNRSK
jgi:hypothetical protein